MVRIALNLYLQPTQVEAFILLNRKDGIEHRHIGIIDTGAEISLFPKVFLDTIEHEIVSESPITLEQAGIAAQTFEVQEAIITLRFEDQQGNISSDMRARVWFGDTTETLIGVRDILDRATLHIDFRETRTGWIEFDD